MLGETFNLKLLTKYQQYKTKMSLFVCVCVCTRVYVLYAICSSEYANGAQRRTRKIKEKTVPQCTRQISSETKALY